MITKRDVDLVDGVCSVGGMSKEEAEKEIDKALGLFLERLRGGLVADEKAAIVHLAIALRGANKMLLKDWDAWGSDVATKFIADMILANGGPLV